MYAVNNDVKLCQYWTESIGLFVFSGITLAIGITLFS